MQVHLRQLHGNWSLGFALHKHTLSSTFTGNNEYGHATFDTRRSDPGEALFRLKYRSDYGQIIPLAIAVAAHIVPRLGAFDAIIPMPATNPRARQPVTEVAVELGRLTGRPVVANLLIKNPALASGPQLKDLTLPEDKRAALAGRFVIDPGALVGESRRDVLLLDDLYDSGATMQSACTALGGCQKISRILVATLTWK